MVDVCRTYQRGAERIQALDHVCMEIARGDLACVLGRSGSGKSTLLQVAGCLDRPDSGQIWLGGQQVEALPDRDRVRLRRHGLGFVFQSFYLLEHLTALENVALPLRYAGASAAERRARAEQLLERMQLGHRRQFLPRQLSGGEQQRVALARALVGNPPLILADEPTGELDSATATVMAQLMRDVNREIGTTFLIVTHDEQLASMATRLFHMQDGQLQEVQRGAS